MGRATGGPASRAGSAGGQGHGAQYCGGGPRAQRRGGGGGRRGREVDREYTAAATLRGARKIHGRARCRRRRRPLSPDRALCCLRRAGPRPRGAPAKNRVCRRRRLGEACFGRGEGKHPVSRRGGLLPRLRSRDDCGDHSSSRRVRLLSRRRIFGKCAPHVSQGDQVARRGRPDGGARRLRRLHRWPRIWRRRRRRAYTTSPGRL
mmetsp:Transcript_30056/g.75286  ORF Transcript_30056/g.75286 Transcript_30056/m.75286 type:complete len:205 (-) Transcript_30056:3111-3725(-)